MVNPEFTQSLYILLFQFAMRVEAWTVVEVFRK